MVDVVEDLFGAGSETTSTTLRWILLLMCWYPDVQDNVRAELLEQIGPNRLPKYSDREHTPYTEAVLLEAQRYANLVPMIRRENTEKVQLFGYEFEQGTVFVANLFHMHRDPAVWEDPESFRPEHFINEERQLINKDRMSPFGLGE